MTSSTWLFTTLAMLSLLRSSRAFIPASPRRVGQTLSVCQRHISIRVRGAAATAVSVRARSTRTALPLSVSSHTESKGGRDGIGAAGVIKALGGTRRLCASSTELSATGDVEVVNPNSRTSTTTLDQVRPGSISLAETAECGLDILLFCGGETACRTRKRCVSSVASPGL